MRCPLCGLTDAACGYPYTGTPVDIPTKGTQMADQGPLVRVDTGRTLIKMSRKAAEAYIAANPGASLSGTPVTPEVQVPTTEFEVLESAQAPEDTEDPKTKVKSPARTHTRG